MNNTKKRIRSISVFRMFLNMLKIATNSSIKYRIRCILLSTCGISHFVCIFKFRLIKTSIILKSNLPRMIQLSYISFVFFFGRLLICACFYPSLAIIVIYQRSFWSVFTNNYTFISLFAILLYIKIKNHIFYSNSRHISI